MVCDVCDRELKYDEELYPIPDLKRAGAEVIDNPHHRCCLSCFEQFESLLDAVIDHQRFRESLNRK